MEIIAPEFNELSQKVIAKERVEWINNKAIFKSNVTNENMMGFINVDENNYMPRQRFTNRTDLSRLRWDTYDLEDVVKKIARKKPLRAVFRDSSFSNSSSKINVLEIFKMISHKTSMKVI